MEWFRQTFRGWLLLVPLSIIILGVIVYRPILDFTFFWEDPFDVGQVEGHSTLDLFLVPTNNLYYRPLLLALVKFLKLGQQDFSPYPFFLFNLIARIVGSLLLFGFARRLLNSASAALGAALIFLLTPIPYDSTAKAMSAHQVLVLPFLSALWLYLEGRQNKRSSLIGLSIVMVIITGLSIVNSP